ncbi:MAG TPA: D-glucuronyl C5-epimerase family protein, partial [Actinopolymorphaceae bacterium]|nr:D-glucuronyl C5-epimerase family protein [Actinopolymorphaceae bacterium]
QAQRLIDTRVESRGAWYYPYRFDFPLYHESGRLVRAPWYSALAQGKALSLFARLAHVTHQARWREAADRTFVSFLNPPSSSAPWVVSVDDEHYLWLVQVPMRTPADSELIFNGQLSAIFGLWEYVRLTNNAEALALYDGSITTLRRYEHVLRVPAWRSTYSRTHPGSASNTYHLLHIRQLAELWLMTGRTEFARLAEALRDDSPDPVLTEPRTIEFGAGRHDGYEFDILTGKVLSHAHVTLPKSATGTTIRRMRMKGHGIYYRVASGPLYNYWVLEQPGRTTVRGPVAELVYNASRHGVLVAGRTYDAAKYDARGLVVATTRVRFPSNTVASFDRTGWIAGERAGHVASGRLAGYWLPTAHVAFD